MSCVKVREEITHTFLLKIIHVPNGICLAIPELYGLILRTCTKQMHRKCLLM